MRKIPVTVNNDHDHQIGWIELEENSIHLESLLNSSVSWYYTKDKKGKIILHSVSFIPNFIPRDL